MNIAAKRILLNQIYEIYNTFSASQSVVCQKSCADCCTSNVTLASIEGYEIIEYLFSEGKSEYLKKVKKTSHLRRYQPRTTINQIAALCMDNEEIPEEENHSVGSHCPLLSDNMCPVYEVRPFGCRCMMSKKRCKETGYAEIDSLVLTVNNLFLQYIEHIDIGGFTGNFTDVILYLASGEKRNFYEKNNLNGLSTGLIPNRPIKILMVPPEHQNQVQWIIKKLQKIKIPSSYKI